MEHLIRRFNDCIAVDRVILVIFHSKLTFAALQHRFPAYPMSFSSHHWWNHVKSHQSFLDESAGNGPHEIHHRNWPWSCSIWPRSGRALLHLLKFVADPCGSSIPRLTMTSMTCQGPMGLKPSNYGILIVCYDIAVPAFMSLGKTHGNPWSLVENVQKWLSGFMQKWLGGFTMPRDSNYWKIEHIKWFSGCITRRAIGFFLDVSIVGWGYKSTYE